MDRQAAAKLVKDTFSNQFEEDRYRLFAKNLFNDLDESKAFAYHGSYIPDAYKDHVRQYKRVGKYTDPEGAELDVLIVYLKKETSLERARTMQRNFIAHYLKNRGEKDAAIVAFCTDGLEDWRFSYVRMDYKTEQTESGKVKIKEELTPARRYSFLVGKNEPNHTAQQQLVPILENDKNNPSLAELEKAFNIESVTKEFFNKYKDLFLKVHEELDAIVAKDKKIKKEFEDKLVDTANFAKKLLGQIVFLYFIQKKGWLGVERDKAWGTGPRNFMRLLHEKAVVDYENFFNDILEPLFYEALAIDRGEVSLYSRFKCKIPFLNGGLFEPVNGYNWEETDILLKNETFAEILGTFDLYNFTVREDEPLEREVAVDPEMLGKVFENLLEVKDRKSKGAYYTPREIVHYMCQQSLISYLDSALNNPLTPTLSREWRGSIMDFQSPLISDDPLPISPPLTGGGEGECEVLAVHIPRQDIELFVRQGDFGIQNDLTVEEKGKETQRYSYKLPEAIRTNAGRIDKTLSDIKICDPAIGSGAFPVGMLHEIVRARETLTVYLSPAPSPPPLKGGRLRVEPCSDKKEFPRPLGERDRVRGDSDERTPYNFKRHAIQESIYGVDIDPGAVDIAKLRLWLSLVVDEDDFRTIKPLPNLDYKIVCGNSLSNVNIMFHHAQLKELEVLKSKYFEETNPRKKIKFKEDISKLIGEITNDDKHFDFKVYFSEVFHKNGGFDVVIANPPYVSVEKFSRTMLQMEWKAQYQTYAARGDIYCFFYERGIALLKKDAVLCYISSNKFMRAGYGKNLRKMLSCQKIDAIIDFCELPVFSASTDPAIVLLRKDTPADYHHTFTAVIKDESEIYQLLSALQCRGTLRAQSSLKIEGWTFEGQEGLKLIDKLRTKGIPLDKYVNGRFHYGIKTGLNEAFVIDQVTRDRLIKEDPKSADLIRKWIRGKDIKRWYGEWNSWYVILFPYGFHFELKKYPAILRHLSQFEQALKERGQCRTSRYGKGEGQHHWLELDNNPRTEYLDVFNKAKIVFNETSKELHAYVDIEGYAINKTGFIILADDPYYVLGTLNSSTLDYLYRCEFPSWGDPWKGGRIQFRGDRMAEVPVPVVSDSLKTPIVERVKAIIANPDSPDVPCLEAEINKLVYALYDLSPEEIAIVEGKR